MTKWRSEVEHGHDRVKVLRQCGKVSHNLSCHEDSCDDDIQNEQEEAAFLAVHIEEDMSDNH